MRTLLILAALIPAIAGAQSQYANLDSARARLSQIDGSLRAPGLDSAVEVLRDTWGVPHIYARTAHDLFFAQGFVAAQDRLFQMEMWRRNGEGRLAEVLGPGYVERDRFARLMRYRGDMNAEWAAYSPDAREISRAFTSGVNAWIRQVRERPPIEFALLGVAPDEWDETVPLNRLAALAMTGNADYEAMRAQLVTMVGPKRAGELWPTIPHRELDPVPGLDLAGINIFSVGAYSFAVGGIGYPKVVGSNNWVVSGAKSETGKPILANDPHRTIKNPSLRYLTHLVGPGWNVIGSGEPAVPGVAVGHNERVAFGLTIVGMDQQDLYVERVAACPSAVQRPGDQSARCSWFNGRWTPLRTIIDTIRVRNAEPRVVRLEFTSHGPLVALDPKRNRAFALRFVGSEPGTAGYLAQLSLDRAHDWPSFQRAAARWKLPTENLIYADVDGNIGWAASGLMPKRSWSGLLPVPGDGRFEWSGFRDASELPSSYNPRSGFIATANNDIRPKGYAPALNFDFATPFRVQRITEVLQSRKKFSVADFMKLQHDELSIPARTLVPLLLAAARRNGSARDRESIGALSRWNYVMSQDSAAPAIFEAWSTSMGHRMLAALARDTIAAFVEELNVSEWAQMLGEVKLAGRDSLMLAALTDADNFLVSKLGADRSAWRWGAIHRASFPHAIASAFDPPSVARGGNANTVNSTSGANYQQSDGASYREIIDVGNWDRSVATSVPGQSGQPASEFYANLLPLWARGEYFPLPFTRAAVEKATAHRLVLTP
ncbi:MAG: Penicillin amidase [Gemmatimonadetes bacterium]|nr:Penicillin amidase [Gemmatimonadota bacterium]